MLFHTLSYRTTCFQYQITKLTDSVTDKARLQYTVYLSLITLSLWSVSAASEAELSFLRTESNSSPDPGDRTNR